MGMSHFPIITTQRLQIRQLEPKDVSGTYLGWLKPKLHPFVNVAGKHYTLDELRDYVAQKRADKHSLLIGLFDRKGENHVGNLKFEPILPEEGYAIYGILIGDVAWHGKGIAQEASAACFDLIHRTLGIKRVVLGVDPENLPAVSAYRKIGFQFEDRPELPLPSNLRTMIAWL